MEYRDCGGGRAKGWSQADLAEYAHITTRETIARYERWARSATRSDATPSGPCAPLPPAVEGAAQRAKAQHLLEQIAARDPRALTLAVAALEGIAREAG